MLICCSGDGGGGIADALRDVQLQVKQLLSQEERLAAAAAAEQEEEEAAADAGAAGGSRRAAASSEDDGPAAAGGSGGEEEEGSDGEGSPAGMLRSTLDLLDDARALLDDAEERVAAYGRQYRFSEAEHRELSSRLQEVRWANAGRALMARACLRGLLPRRCRGQGRQLLTLVAAPPASLPARMLAAGAAEEAMGCQLRR